MKSLAKLVKGYKRFLQNDFQNHQERYRLLAEEGQSPKIMMIGCSDSRVNPDMIFKTKPGDLFVVRNVANLVPPFEPDDAYHGTSAAIEFAVTVLKVQHIVIMGHSLCGGVKACCDGLHGDDGHGLFIPQWTSILNHCAKSVLADNPDVPPEVLHEKVGKAAVGASLEHLKVFPFVRAAIEQGDLQIHGAYFDIRDAQLYALDQENGNFIPVE